MIRDIDKREYDHGHYDHEVGGHPGGLTDMEDKEEPICYFWLKVWSVVVFLLTIVYLVGPRSPL